MASIVVVGSTNLDLVATGDRLPAPGETVTRATLERHRGGKGANQALAAARFGATVAFNAATGDDGEGDFAVELLHAAGVDLSRVVRVAGVSTGIALIMVDGAGENQIMVASGANGRLTPEHVDASGFDALLVQFEVPPEAVAEAIRQATGLVVVNAAPARPIPEGTLGRTDVVIVNEGEYAELADELGAFDGIVIRTLGADGAEALVRGTVIARVPAPEVDAVDTVGAGDAFCGVFTAALADGQLLEDAMGLGCAAGAVAASRPGVQASLGTRTDIDSIHRDLQGAPS
jgi:ribokinase